MMEARRLASISLLTFFSLLIFIPVVNASIGDLSVCFPFFLILALLIAALYAQGKSPFAGFDISGIAPAGMVRSSSFRPKTYTMGGNAILRGWMGKIKGGNIVTRGAGTIGYGIRKGLSKAGWKGKEGGKGGSFWYAMKERGFRAASLGGVRLTEKKTTVKENLHGQIKFMEKEMLRLGRQITGEKQKSMNKFQVRDIKKQISALSAERKALKDNLRKIEAKGKGDQKISVWEEVGKPRERRLGIAGTLQSWVYGGGQLGRQRGEMYWNLKEFREAGAQVRSLQQQLKAAKPGDKKSLQMRLAQQQSKMQMNLMNIRRQRYAYETLKSGAEAMSRVVSVQGMIRTAGAVPGMAAGIILQAPTVGKRLVQKREAIGKARFEKLQNKWWNYVKEKQEGKTKDSFRVWSFKSGARQTGSKLKELGKIYWRFYAYYFVGELPFYFVPARITKFVFFRKERRATEAEQRIERERKIVREGRKTDWEIEGPSWWNLWTMHNYRRNKREFEKLDSLFDENLEVKLDAKGRAGSKLSLQWGFWKFGKGGLPLFIISGPRVIPWAMITSPSLAYRTTGGKLGGSQMEKDLRAIEVQKTSELRGQLHRARSLFNQLRGRSLAVEEFMRQVELERANKRQQDKMAQKIKGWIAGHPLLEQHADLIFLLTEKDIKNPANKKDVLERLQEVHGILKEDEKLALADWRKIHESFRYTKYKFKMRRGVFDIERQKDTGSYGRVRRLFGKTAKPGEELRKNDPRNMAINRITEAYREERFISSKQAEQGVNVENLRKDLGMWIDKLHETYVNFGDKGKKDSILNSMRDIVSLDVARRFGAVSKEQVSEKTNSEIDRFKGLSKDELRDEINEFIQRIAKENNKLRLIRNADADVARERTIVSTTKLARASRFFGAYFNPSELQVMYTVGKQMFYAEMGWRTKLRARAEEPSDSSLRSIILTPNCLMEWSFRNLIDNWQAMRHATNYYETTAFPMIQALSHAQADLKYMFGRFVAISEEQEMVSKAAKKRGIEIKSPELFWDVEKGKIRQAEPSQLPLSYLFSKDFLEGHKNAELSMRQKVIGLLPIGEVPIVSKIADALGIKTNLSQRIINNYTPEQLEKKVEELERVRQEGFKKYTSGEKRVKELVGLMDRELAMLDARKGSAWATDAMRETINRFRDENTERLRKMKEENKTIEDFKKHLTDLEKDPLANKELIERTKKQIEKHENRIKELAREVRQAANPALAQNKAFFDISEIVNGSLVIREDEKLKNNLRDISEGMGVLGEYITLQDTAEELKKRLKKLEQEPVKNKELIESTKKEIDAKTGKLQFVSLDKRYDDLTFRLNNYLDKHGVDASKFKPSEALELLEKLRETVREDYGPVNIMLRDRELGRRLGLPFPGKEGPLRQELLRLEQEYAEQAGRVATLERMKDRLSKEEKKMYEAEKRKLDILTNKVNVTNSQIYLYTMELEGVIKPHDGIMFDKFKGEIDKLAEEVKQTSPDKLMKKMDEYTKKAVTYQFAYYLKRGELDVLKDPETDALKPSQGRLTARESTMDLGRLRRLYPELEMPARKIALDMEVIDQKLRLQELIDKKEEVKRTRGDIDLKLEQLFRATLPEQSKDRPLHKQIEELGPQLTGVSKAEFDDLLAKRAAAHKRIDALDYEIRAINTSATYLEEITKNHPYDPLYPKSLERLKQWWGPSWYGSSLERFSRWVKGEGAYDAWVPNKKRINELDRYLILADKFKEGKIGNEGKMQLEEELKRRHLTEEDLEIFKRNLEREKDRSGSWVIKKHQGMEYVIESPEYRWVKPLYKTSRWLLIAGAITAGVTAPFLGITLAAPLVAKKGLEKVADWGRFGGAIAPGSSERGLRDLQIVEYWTTRGRGAYPSAPRELWEDYIFFGEFWKRGTRITADGNFYFHKDSIKLKPVGMEGIFYPLRLIKGIVEPPVLDMAAAMRLEYASEVIPGGKPALKQILIENPMVKAEIESITPHQTYKVLGVEGNRPYAELVQSFMAHPEQLITMPYEEAAAFTHVMRYEALTVAEREEARVFRDKGEVNKAYGVIANAEAYRGTVVEGSGDKNAFRNKLHNAISQIDDAIGQLSQNAKPEDLLVISELRATRCRLELELNSVGEATRLPDIIKEDAKEAYGEWRKRVSEELKKAREMKDDKRINVYEGKLAYINVILSQITGPTATYVT